MNNILDEIKANARKEYIPIMDDECEKVLVDLMKKYNPKNVLEIGTCVGYSSTIIMQNSNAHVDTIEIDDNRRKQAIDLWNHFELTDRVTSYLGNVDEILEDVISGKEYDFVFIDGPKSRYLEHLQKCFNNVKQNGIILADDVLFFGLVEGDAQVNHKHRTIVRHLREFMQFVKTSDLIETEIIDKGNGIAIMRKK